LKRSGNLGEQSKKSAFLIIVNARGAAKSGPAGPMPTTYSLPRPSAPAGSDNPMVKSKNIQTIINGLW
jgi:hypothetical protein